MGRTRIRDGRKAEFIDAAEALFNENGFENTSVEDIVQRVGVAKGLFYYYFESKEALMTAMVNKIMEEIRTSMEQVMADEGLTTIDRLAEIMASNQVIRSRSRELNKWFHDEGNQALHLCMEERSANDIVPVLEAIILQGIEEGIFQTDYPRESAVAALSLFRSIMNDKDAPDGEGLPKAARVMGYLTERMLGAEEGTFGPVIDRVVDGETMAR